MMDIHEKPTGAKVMIAVACTEGAVDEGASSYDSLRRNSKSKQQMLMNSDIQHDTLDLLHHDLTTAAILLTCAVSCKNIEGHPIAARASSILSSTVPNSLFWFCDPGNQGIHASHTAI
jgi:hypothetical protein